MPHRRRRLIIRPVRTGVDGGVAGALLSGAFEAPVQSVHVDARGLRPEPTTIDTKIDAMWKIVEDMDKRLWHDGKDRQKRQEATDGHREVVATRLGEIDQHLQIVARLALISQILSTLAIGVCIVLVLDFGHRMAWW